MRGGVVFTGSPMVHCSTLRWFAALLLAMVLPPAAALPASPPGDLPLQAHWLTDDGAPADIWGLAQSDDGYLWLGTGAGLYRFDGVEFRHVPQGAGEAETTNITSLAHFGDGPLWLGYYSGRIERFEAGRLHVVPGDGRLPGMVRAMARTRDGVVWVATDTGPRRIEGGRVVPLTHEWAYPSDESEFLVVDREGTLWVATGHSLAFLREGDRMFTEVALPLSDDVAMTVGPDGRVWVSDARLGTFALPAGLARASTVALRTIAPPTEPLFAKRLLFDASGHLWITVANGRGGLARMAGAAAWPSMTPVDESRVEARVDERQGLPSNVVVPVFQSREGAVWVGSNAGLSQFREGCFEPLVGLSDAPHAGFGLTVAPSGRLWASNARRVMHADGMDGILGPTAWPTFSGAVSGRDGVSWFVGGRGLWSDAGAERPSFVSMPSSIARARLTAIAADHRGGVYVGTQGAGLHHFRDGRWRQIGPDDAAVPHGAMVVGDDGRLWRGRGPDLEVHAADGRRQRVFDASDGLAVGVLSALHVAGGQVVVGGEQGVAVWAGDRFVSLPASMHAAFGGVTGIVGSPDGDLWLLGRRGLVQVSSMELAAWGEGRVVPGVYRVYDRQDGLEGVALQSVLASTLRMGADGRLWIATNRGVSTASAEALKRCGSAPPAASIDEVTVDGRRLPLGELIETTADPRSLVIRYTAPSLVPPGRARFLIRMAGVDDAWRSVGSTREVTYASLAPGAYTFSVVAVAEDGEWSPVVASQRIEVPPTFVESPLFRVGLVALLTFGLVTGYRLQLRAMTRRLRERLAVRAAERERIARELHDTLLQGVQGLILTIHAASVRVTDAGVRETLARALDRAESALEEGRDRVQDLRVTGEARGDLVDALRRLGEDLAQIHAVPFRLVAAPLPEGIGTEIADEVFRVAAEAVRNAFLHARASMIEVELDGSGGTLRVWVRDDGVGIDADVVERGRRPGHWGLAGMRERAEALGGHLRVLSRAGAGTEVEFTLPLKTARGGARGGSKP